VAGENQCCRIYSRCSLCLIFGINRVKDKVGMQFTVLSNTLKRIAVIIVASLLATTACAAPTEKVLYTFTGGADGGSPSSGLISDTTGNLYGMTGGGGAHELGTVFELQQSNGQWTEVVLHSFADDGVDGYSPLGGLVADKSGNLYGTTMFGGAQIFGIVFELSPSSNGWTETVLYNFSGGADGGIPTNGGLVFDQEGNLYGATENFGAYGYGVVFKLSPSSGGGWTENVLHSFAETESDGGGPTSVVVDRKGNLYGTTTQGGAYRFGTAFQLTPSSQGAWTETILHDFGNGLDGAHPVSGVIVAAGRLFGTTEYGGHYGLGAVYALTHAGNQVKETLLDNFTSINGDGFAPQSVVTFDEVGNLYSTTYGGGADEYGTVFELVRSEKKQRLLYSFTGGSDGGYLTNGVILDGQGNLYGTTQCGGSGQDCGGYGVVFEIVK